MSQCSDGDDYTDTEMQCHGINTPDSGVHAEPETNVDQAEDINVIAEEFDDDNETDAGSSPINREDQSDGQIMDFEHEASSNYDSATSDLDDDIVDQCNAKSETAVQQSDHGEDRAADKKEQGSILSKNVVDFDIDPICPSTQGVKIESPALVTRKSQEYYSTLKSSEIFGLLKTEAEKLDPFSKHIIILVEILETRNACTAVYYGNDEHDWQDIELLDSDAQPLKKRKRLGGNAKDASLDNRSEGQLHKEIITPNESATSDHLARLGDNPADFKDFSFPELIKLLKSILSKQGQVIADVLKDKYQLSQRKRHPKTLKTSLTHPLTAQAMKDCFFGLDYDEDPRRINDPHQPKTEEERHPWLPTPESTVPEYVFRVWDCISKCKITDSAVGFLSGSPWTCLNTPQLRKQWISRHINWRNRINTPFISITTSLNDIQVNLAPRLQKREKKQRKVANTKLTLISCQAIIAKGKPVLNVLDEMEHYAVPIDYKWNSFKHFWVVPYNIGPDEIVETFRWFEVEKWMKKNKSGIQAWKMAVALPKFKEHESSRLGGTSKCDPENPPKPCDCCAAHRGKSCNCCGGHRFTPIVDDVEDERSGKAKRKMKKFLEEQEKGKVKSAGEKMRIT